MKEDEKRKEKRKTVSVTTPVQVVLVPPVMSGTRGGGQLIDHQVAGVVEGGGVSGARRRPVGSIDSDKIG